MKAKRVLHVTQNKDGRQVEKRYSVERFYEHQLLRGNLPVDYKPEGRFVPLNEEVQGQPIWSHLIGPIYESDGVVRYDDVHCYELLFDPTRRKARRAA